MNSSQWKSTQMPVKFGRNDNNLNESTKMYVKPFCDIFIN